MCPIFDCNINERLFLLFIISQMTIFEHVRLFVATNFLANNNKRMKASSIILMFHVFKNIIDDHCTDHPSSTSIFIRNIYDDNNANHNLYIITVNIEDSIPINLTHRNMV